MSDKVTRRRFLKGLAVVAGSGVLAACKPEVVKETVIVEKPVEKVVKETVLVEQPVEKVVTATPPPAPAPVRPETIDWWEVTWVGAEDIVRSYEKAYQDAGNNIKVNFQGFPADRLPERLLISMAAGTGPAIFRQNDVEWPKFVMNKAADPLPPELFGESDYAGLAKYYHPGILDIQYAQDGKIYTMVDTATVYGHVYNATVLEEAGLPRPSTTEPMAWDDWGVVTQAVTQWESDRLVRSGYAARFDAWKETFQNYVFMLTRQSSGRLASEDWKKALLDTPETVKGCQIFVDFYKKYRTIAPGFVTDPNGDFANGRIVSLLTYPAFYAGAKAKNLPFEVAAAPLCVVKGGKRVTCASYAAWLVNPRLSEAIRTEAWKMLAFILLNPESRKFNVEEWGSAIASPSPYTEAKMQEDPNTIPFYGTQQWSEPAFPHPAALEFKDVVMKAIAEMIVNDVAVVDALKEAQKEADAVLARY